MISISEFEKLSEGLLWGWELYRMTGSVFATLLVQTEKNYRIVDIELKIIDESLFSTETCEFISSKKHSKSHGQIERPLVSYTDVPNNRLVPQPSCCEFCVEYGTDEFRSQQMTRSSVAIGIAHDFEYLNLRIDVFNDNPPTRQFPIQRLLRRR